MELSFHTCASEGILVIEIKSLLSALVNLIGLGEDFKLFSCSFNQIVKLSVKYGGKKFLLLFLFLKGKKFIK